MSCENPCIDEKLLSDCKIRLHYGGIKVSERGKKEIARKHVDSERGTERERESA